MRDQRAHKWIDRIKWEHENHYRQIRLAKEQEQARRSSEQLQNALNLIGRTRGNRDAI